MLSALIRGCVGAVLFGVLGWVAGMLTIGMVFSRHLTSAQEELFQRGWLCACLVAGFAAGVWVVPARMTPRLGWICWGAVFGLGLLTIVTRLPIAVIPGADRLAIAIPGTSFRISLDEAGLLSAPGALVAGGVLGWLLSRQKERRSLDEPRTD